ncbi:hypothetical protein Tco_1366143 [Tanacetum coccineum]
MDSTKIIFKRVTRFIPIPRAKFEITLQLCLFDGSNPKNNDELQPRLSNFFKIFDSNGGEDLCYQGGLDQSALSKMWGALEELMHFFDRDFNSLTFEGNVAHLGKVRHTYGLFQL